MASGNIALRDMRQMEITVRVSKIFWLRLWVLKTLLMLAARISRATIVIEDGE